MFDSVKQGAAGMVDHLGRPFLSRPKIALHPLDDPEVWRKQAAYDAPADIDIKAEQRWIDNLMGTTRNGQSIYKLVWNGDREYWHYFFMRTNAYGKPTDPPVGRPRVRHKVVRDDKNQMLRDVFPPRWLILTRIEPEQYADTYKRESYIWDPALNCERQIRPDEPPEVFWVWFATLAHHSDFCCTTAEKEKRLCFGKYVPPSYARSILENQRANDLANGNMRPFEKVDGSFLSEVEDESNGYKLEMMELEQDFQIAIENPMALIGIEASMRAEIDTPAKARAVVKDYYNRQMDDLSRLV